MKLIASHPLLINSHLKDLQEITIVIIITVDRLRRNLQRTLVMVIWAVIMVDLTIAAIVMVVVEGIITIVAATLKEDVSLGVDHITNINFGICSAITTKLNLQILHGNIDFSHLLFQENKKYK